MFLQSTELILQRDLLSKGEKDNQVGSGSEGYAVLKPWEESEAHTGDRAIQQSRESKQVTSEAVTQKVTQA